MKTFTEELSAEKLAGMKGWHYSNNAIEKKFVFKDFQEAMAVMVRISYVAEKMNHHPEWMNVYNKLTIRLSTHDAGGVTEKDFDLAREIDRITGK